MKILLEKTIENEKQIKRIKSQLGNVIEISSQDGTIKQRMVLVGINLRDFSLDFKKEGAENYSNKTFDETDTSIPHISGRAMCNGVELFEF